MAGGKQKPRLQGYTIVETMIFLAVSGVMFLIAASFINGKQAEAEFRNNITGFASSLNQTLNDVANGTSGTDGQQCQEVAGVPTITTGTNSYGDCIFLGKTISLLDSSDYANFSIVGNRLGQDGNDAVDFSVTGANPVLDNGSEVKSSLSGATIQRIDIYTTASVHTCFAGATLTGGPGLAILSTPNAGLSSTADPVNDTTNTGSATNAALYSYTQLHSGVNQPITPSASPLYQVIMYLQDGSHEATVTIGGTVGLTVTSNLVYSGSETCS
jgi:Tfp pilus assembly protein FimT